MPLPTYPELEKKAQTLGFHHIGVLSVPSLEKEGVKLHEWLQRGYHGDMDWMANHVEKRVDPGALMDNTQSIVVATMNYYTGDHPVEAEAKIARYALGRDYHKVIRKRLKKLLQWLQTYDASIEGRPLTDSAPMMEKPVAVKAGLGWQGKHSMLITPDIGSWVFIGELLLNVTFPDAPVPKPINDLCGNCRRCIEACPTDAIPEPHVLDSNRCISYWTIEHKGDTIPAPIREHLEGWVFGCDICQEVCPWNIKFQQLTEEADFQPRPWNKAPTLQELQALTDETFEQRYQGSPIKRTKLTGLQRNAAAIEQG